MSYIDWVIVCVPLIIMACVAYRTRAYVKGVSDFLAARRSAGRYLVCNAEAAASTGAISIVATCEMYYKSGFAIGWWFMLSMPIMLIVTLSGWIIYRYRETRVMTLAQFFEVRYSKRFRIFMGFLAFISGILNYGIFPAVGARFFVYYCSFPETLHWAGLDIPTFAALMAILMTVNVCFATMGGQLTAMVTDCIEGMLSSVMFLVVAVTIIVLFPWSRMSAVLTDSLPGKSMVDPFDTTGLQGFNLWYVGISIVGGVYAYMTWQGTQGFNASALNPHEAKMGRVLASWRGNVRTILVMTLALAAITYMRHPLYADGAAAVNQQLSVIRNPAIRSQMTVPVALSHLLPVGVKGVLCAIMLFGLIATDAAYMHSWGSILIQDVVLPFRQKPLSPERHLRLLRWSIMGVAAFAFFFSLLFRQTDYILMFMAVTGAVFMGGAGSVLIGGLYWKKGTTAAAWSAMITGAVLAVTGIVGQQVSSKFPINGQWMWLISIGGAISVYVVVSLLTCREEFNLNRMLHRGAYAVDDEGNPLPEVEKPPRTWKSFLGIDEHFTRSDKFQSIFLFVWTMLWFAAFVVMALWNLMARWPTKWWANYQWFAGLVVPLVIGGVTTIWFGWGGIRDLIRLFRRLNTTSEDAHDNGIVGCAVVPVQAVEAVVPSEELDKDTVDSYR